LYLLSGPFNFKKRGENPSLPSKPNPTNTGWLFSTTNKIIYEKSQYLMSDDKTFVSVFCLKEK